MKKYFKIVGTNFSILKSNRYFKKFLNDGIVIESHGQFNFYCSLKLDGLEFVLDKNNIIQAVHFYGRNNVDFCVFEDILPFNINILDSKVEVFTKFKEYEIRNGGGELLPFIGKSNLWSLFMIEGLYFRFEFFHDDITLITLMDNK